MLVDERRNKVLGLVQDLGFIELSKLVADLNCSESTIRRDLDYWQSQGVIRRTHGGAIYTGEGMAAAHEERAVVAQEEKKQAARIAAAQVRDGDTVLLNGGTTTLEVAKQLMGRSLQIVTNSLPIANLFAGSPDVDLVLLGGFILPRTGVALGPLTVGMLNQLNVATAILSVAGITENGLFNSNLLLAETERCMIQRAKKVFVVADHSKIGRQAMAFLGKLSEVDSIIVDMGVTPDQRRIVEAHGGTLLVDNEMSH